MRSISRWEIDTGVMAPYAEGWEISALGSTAYRMLKVAEGSAHAFVSPAWKHEWDVCGAALLVTEAGGVVTRGDGEPLRFNRPAPDLQGIIARASSVEVPYLAPARRQRAPPRQARNSPDGPPSTPSVGTGTPACRPQPERVMHTLASRPPSVRWVVTTPLGSVAMVVTRPVSRFR